MQPNYKIGDIIRFSHPYNGYKGVQIIINIKKGNYYYIVKFYNRASFRMNYNINLFEKEQNYTKKFVGNNFKIVNILYGT